jgi:7-cyano-7-deazaguanine synthase
MGNERVVVIMSGGLDSTTLLYDLLEGGFSPFCLSFNYGQRHSKEIQYAKNTCRKLGVEHRTLNLAVSGLTELIATSALTAYERTEEAIAEALPKMSGTEQAVIQVPEGHYAEENMKATVVPNRNMIMLSMGAAVAVSQGARYLATAVHAGDHFIYPDCRPGFIYTAESAIVEGNEGFIDPEFELMTPYINKTKEDIAYRALELGVPFSQTWSCYKGGHQHCGRCGTCVERLEAIDGAQRRWEDTCGEKACVDATMYEDKDFWRKAVADK